MHSAVQQSCQKASDGKSAGWISGSLAGCGWLVGIPDVVRHRTLRRESRFRAADGAGLADLGAARLRRTVESSRERVRRKGSDSNGFQTWKDPLSGDLFSGQRGYKFPHFLSTPFPLWCKLLFADKCDQMPKNRSLPCSVIVLRVRGDHGGGGVVGGEQGREREGEGDDEGIERGASVTAASYSRREWSGRGVVQRRREKSLTETRAKVIFN